VRFEPDAPLPAALADLSVPDAATAVREALRGHLDVSGPITARGLAEHLALAERGAGRSFL